MPGHQGKQVAAERGAFVLPWGAEAEARAASLLRQGGVVVFPTDTVYGVGTNAFAEAAVLRLYEIKKRPRSKGVPVLVADEEGIARVAKEVSEMAWALIRAFMPGPLTLVLAKGEALPAAVASAEGKVAVRIPAHQAALNLIRAVGGPLAATSANLSGRPSARTAEEAAAQLGSLVDLILDGGPATAGVESTVLDLTGDEPQLVREGALPARELVALLGVELTVTKEAHDCA